MYADESKPSTNETATAPTKQRRGFALMDPDKRRAISALGGRASHASGRGHEWDSTAAREAGRKGGAMSRGGRGKLRPDETPAEEPTTKG